MVNFTTTWIKALEDVLSYGEPVSPRGSLTRELPQMTIDVDMRDPVLRSVERKLNYRFMAAEAYWILSGDDKVSGIAPWNPRIAEFSDDGESFFGAYGPKIEEQLPYVVNKLIADPDTRQAGLTIWRPLPPLTKDVPCTVAIFFGIRGGKLNCHVFMRSSDLWLGLPYDVFNFSMLSHLVCSLVRENSELAVSPGMLYLTSASSHLYETNWTDATNCVLTHTDLNQYSTLTPSVLWQSSERLLDYLKVLRDTSPGSSLRWWENLNAS